MSCTVSRSAGSRLVADDEKATLLPSAEIDATELSPLPFTPVSEVETRAGSPVAPSFTKTSYTKSVAAGSRLTAEDANATLVPSADIEAFELLLLPFTPA